MSNLYSTEPATNGKVIIDTTAGEIEVELWGKEAPLAVRNFLALSMEGYYDGVIFHRVVPGFIVQSGDPTGTGMGGESFYGEPFKDEIHGRLKFNRRGLLGMANNSKRNTNNSQFFFTLDRADELTGKHTLFGKITGNTIFKLDAQERPTRPPKIRSIRIIENPFDDIVPRITAAERKAQAQAKIDARKDAEAREKKAKAKKNTGLLSFGDSEELPNVEVKRKGIGREDLVQSDAPKPAPSFVDIPESIKDLGASPKPKKVVNLREIRAQHQREKEGGTAARQAEIKQMQENLRRLKKRAGEGSDSESDDDKRKRKGPSYLEQELAKYQKGRGRAVLRAANSRRKREEEDDLLEEMSRFSTKVASVESVLEEEQEGEELEVDDDVGWMRHELKFDVDEKELTRRAEEEYDVVDPRAKAREIAKKEKKG